MPHLLIINKTMSANIHLLDINIAIVFLLL